MNGLEDKTKRTAFDEKYVNTAITHHRTQIEKNLAYARIVVIVLLLLRLLGVEFRSVVWITGVFTSIVGLFWCAYILTVIRQGNYTQALAWRTVFIEYSLLFISYIGNSVNADANYPGNLNLPDLSILVILLFISGFRLSVKIVQSASVFTVLILGFLVYFDFQQAGIVYSYETLSMWITVSLAASMTAFFLVYRIRDMTSIAVSEARKAAELQRGVSELLESHHDAHALLSTLNLNMDRLKLAVNSQPKIKHLTHELAKDVQLINDCITSVKHDADARLVSANDLMPVNLVEVIQQYACCFKTLQRSIHLDLGFSEKWVLIAGGRIGAIRILQNLINNAVEGNGKQCAQSIEISLEQCGKYTRMCVADDGPGFKQSPACQKSTSMGVGLKSVATIVAASEGKIDFGESKYGGALVVVCFTDDK